MGIISNNLAETSAKGNGKGKRNLFLSIKCNNLSSISLKLIISGPTHSIIWE